MIDLETPGALRAISDQIKADIDAYCVEKYTDGHRDHLGASIIAHDCWRYSWNVFRWTKREIFDGRMLRLFQYGHEEEHRIHALLEGIGMQVWANDPNTNKPVRITGSHGHYGGSLDRVVRADKYVGKMPILGEFKTHNYKSFAKLVNEKSVVKTKPRHYGQMCAYGKHWQFQYGLYFAVGKNDSEIYVELVKLDWSMGDDLADRAHKIIASQIPPERIALSPSYFECKYCPFQGQCHRGEAIEKNCRSCEHAFPTYEGQWHCAFHKANIPKDFIKTGCGSYSPIVKG